jgi:hypothetical protein
MVAINLQSISCRPIKTATVTRDRRIATVAVAHNATQKAAKETHRYAAVLLAGCTAALIAVVRTQSAIIMLRLEATCV